MGEGFEDGNVSESTGEGSEQDIQRVHEATKKAKQVRTQIKNMQNQNMQFALMLSLLLQLINDDKVLGYVFTQLIDQKIPTPAIFAQFLPFLKSHVDIATYQPLYGPLREKMPDTLGVVSLVAWLKEVKGASQALKDIDMKVYIPFVLDYLQWMQVIDLTNLEPEKLQELEQTISKELK